MNILNQSDLNNRPFIKYIIIAVIAVNAVILALLLFGPGRLSSAVSPWGTDRGQSAGGSTAEISEDRSSQDDEDDRHHDRDDEDDSEDSGEADTDETAEGEMPASGPLLELVDDHVTLKVGDYFNFYDYIKTMEDRDGSNLSRYIHLVGDVNTYQPGDYTITYQITSQIDGETASKDLRVTVEY